MPTERCGTIALHRPVIVFGLLLFILALGPRWVPRDTYVTADEDNWMRRAGGFAWGVANGRLGRTYQNGHPGVLTMELAILGQGPGGAERFGDPVTGDPRLVSAEPGFFDALVQARRAFSLASAALVAGVGMLAWRLFGPGPGVIGGVLLALDPFFLAHSQLVHLDALLSGCMGLAVLCGLMRWGAGGGRRWVLAGGGLSGLALLAKAPAVYLAIFIPLLAFILRRGRVPRALSLDLALWAASGLVTFVVLWPSLWVNPISTITRMLVFARETGGQPHEQGSFFLGQQVVDPGPLFYIVALPLRLTPATMLGLLALALILWRGAASLPAVPRQLIISLVVYVLGFGLLMTLGAKKFDRYLLPVFPILDILAGFGLWMFGCSLNSLWQMREKGASLGLPLSILFAFLVGLPLATVIPHYLAYYNPLLGGGTTAVRAIPVGEGEGLKEVGVWLNGQPGAENLNVASHSFDALRATFVGGGEPLRDRVPLSSDYVVLYNYQVQIGQSPLVLAEYLPRAPEYIVRLNGIDYARVYRGPRASRGQS